jgi:hypothetical protein
MRVKSTGNMPITRAYSARRDERREKKICVLIWTRKAFRVRSGQVRVCMRRQVHAKAANIYDDAWLVLYSESEFWGKNGTTMVQ